jgi:hypothetical protein
MLSIGSLDKVVSILVTSTVMRQGEKSWDSPYFVFVGEDGEEDAVH